MKKALVFLAILAFLLGAGHVLAVDKTSLSEMVVNQSLGGSILLSPLRYGIHNAVAAGVDVNTIALLLLFPLVATMVAFSRQVIGVNGFGIFTPALVTVAFAATGIPAGLLLFGAIMLTATVGRFLISKVKMPYLPRMAVLIWGISLGVLALVLLAPTIGLLKLVTFGIFPILLFVMMAETYIEAQITRTWQTAALMTGETLAIAIVGSLIIGMGALQRLVLTYPEISVLTIVILDYIIGRYKGLRLLEMWRFRQLLKA